MSANDTRKAMAALDAAQADLVSARQLVLVAHKHLTGARADRAGQLADSLIDALAFAQRLRFSVEGDYRADSYEPNTTQRQQDWRQRRNG
ncbi:hypothetical protein MSP7336_03364 [Mycobacterium shimoidei]|uniref:Uncharacterized protein n=1 Tax=Mycobacterium shimoidei TaxID=29313 RepID=A0A375Z2E1_MYCSH|nr:hypothetical protein [Mycobacterium shimoidei]SRX95100.1 hypothetical protein MSP7336_03364 [Mycobacterium shimoidei]